MIDIRIRQENACNRTVARRVAARLQLRHDFDLPWQIRRCIDQEPALKVFGVAIDGDARLCLRRNFAGPRGDAVCASIIPLRQAAAGRAAKNTDANQPELSQSINHVRSNRPGVTRALEKDRNGFQHRFDPPLFCSSHKSHGSHRSYRPYGSNYFLIKLMSPLRSTRARRTFERSSIWPLRRMSSSRS